MAQQAVRQGVQPAKGADRGGVHHQGVSEAVGLAQVTRRFAVFLELVDRACITEGVGFRDAGVGR
jgi:hypothetical protein